MLVRERVEYRIQGWDGQCWRQGIAMKTEAEASHALSLRHRKHPDQTIRIIKVTTRVEAACYVGPDPVEV
jgi:hypothetical protein